MRCLMASIEEPPVTGVATRFVDSRVYTLLRQSHACPVRVGCSSHRADFTIGLRFSGDAGKTLQQVLLQGGKPLDDRLFRRRVARAAGLGPDRRREVAVPIEAGYDMPV